MRSKFLTAILLASMLVPTHISAAGRVTVETTIAGLEAQAELAGFPASTNVEVHVVSPSNDDSAIPARTDASGMARVSIPSSLLEEAGTYEAYVRFGTGIAATVDFEVLPDRVDPGNSTVAADSGSVTPDGRDEVTVTVTLVDAYGNPLGGRPVELISSRPEDKIAPLTRETDASGAEHFSVRTLKPGQMVLRAMDLLSGTTIGGSLQIAAQNGVTDARPVGNSYTAQLTDPEPAAPPLPPSGSEPASSGVSFGSAESFDVTLQPEQPKVNEVLNLTIEALDANGLTAEDYVGQVELYTDTDPGAVVPGFGDGHGEVSFKARDLGLRRIPLSVSFSRPGRQTLKVIDKTDPAHVIQGSITVNVSGGEVQSGRKIEILSHKDGGRVTGVNILLEGIGPAYSNLTVTGGLTDVAGETDGAGKFSIPVDLDPALNEYVLRVREESRGDDSGPIHLVRDNVAPLVQFHFDPPQPQEGSEVLLTVASEPHLKSVTMTISNQSLELSELVATPGQYQVVFRAPPQGQYPVSVAATDDVDNTGNAAGSMLVRPRDVPVPQNVRTETMFNGVNLSWDGLDNEGIDSYVVHVGTGAGAFSSSLDTHDARTGVAVMGLKGGVTYYFNVTAKKGILESQPSETVTAVPLGLSMDAKAQDGALLIEWSYPDEQVKSFILEYGIEKDKYLERRLIEGKQRAYMLHDLINGITYHMRMTPVSVTGDVLKDMAAEAEGTPKAGTPGFHAGPSDPAPFPTDPNDATVAPPNGMHDGAPSTTGSGIPSVALMGIVCGTAIGFILWWNKKRSLKQAEEFLKIMNARYGR